MLRGEVGVGLFILRNGTAVCHSAPGSELCPHPWTIITHSQPSGLRSLSPTTGDQQAVQLLNSDTTTRSLLGNPVATLEGLALMKDRVRPSWVSEAQLLPLSAAGCPCVLYPHRGQGYGVWSLHSLTEFHQENVNSPQSLKSM